jgi:hypothetical protein
MISRRQMRFFVAAAEAVPVCMESKTSHFSYMDENGCYFGDDITGDVKVLEQLSKSGIVRVIDGELVQFSDRGDFLASWKAGVNAAQSGEGFEYSSYNSMPVAYMAGYQHYKEREKGSSTIPYKAEYDRFCHGFVCVDTGEVWDQSMY